MRRTGNDAAARHGSFVVTGLALPDGSSIDIELEKFRVIAPDARFVVVGPDGRENEVAFDAERVLFLRGRVLGAPGSHVCLSLRRVTFAPT